MAPLIHFAGYFTYLAMFLRSSDRPVLNIAHRGARSLAPENTIAAAQKAYQVGSDMWELDVNMTADGALIVVHDDTLERTSNVKEVFPERRPWRVHDFSLEEIRRLDFGSWFTRDQTFGRLSVEDSSGAAAFDFAGEPAPTLEEALRFTLEHDWLVNVEIKDLSRTRGHKIVVEEIAALVEKLGIIEQVLISSFNHSYLQKLKAINHKIAVGALVNTRSRNPSHLLRRLDAASYHPRTGAVRVDEIKKLRGDGFDVFVWVVNDPVDMHRAISSGVSGIFTDCPQVLRQVLRSLEDSGSDE